MFVFIPGSIPPVRFGPTVTDPAKISIPAVTFISCFSPAAPAFNLRRERAAGRERAGTGSGGRSSQCYLRF